MAPRGVSWRRPHTSIYNDNYKYGTNLYSGTLSDIQKKYMDSMSKTQMRSDRPDLGLSSFAGSNIGSPPPPAAAEQSPANPPTSLPTSPIGDLPAASSYHGSIFESMLNSALHSSYAADLTEEKVTTPSVTLRLPSEPTTKPTNRVIETPKPAVRTEQPRPTSLYDDAGLFTPMRKILEPIETDDKRKKKTAGRDVSSPAATTAVAAAAATQQSNHSNNPNYWKDQCRDLQSQVDMLTQALSDVSNKLKGELSTMRTQLKTEISDLHSSLEQSSQQSNDLQKTVKKQANQLLGMQTSYEDLHRQMQDSLEEVNGWQRRNQTLRKEMDRLRSDVEETLQRSSNIPA